MIFKRTVIKLHHLHLPLLLHPQKVYHHHPHHLLHLKVYHPLLHQPPLKHQDNNNNRDNKNQQMIEMLFWVIYKREYN